ncbi:MAG: N-acetylmuramoyl-L-alanine amidase [Acetobacteraceae bacterium]|nr:N-acetylmuramoyl-L-alanine amidase [Acetobacteraceae bacterium]
MLTTPTRRGLILAAAAIPAAAIARPLARPAVLRKPAPPPPLVMLDPGHGGKDPGAIGISGTYEKHIAFAAAGEVRRQLLLGRRCRVETTRLRDVFVPLEGRVAYAQRRGAALFVSLHADAVADHDVRGASVYTLSDTASDAQSAALAQRENSADRFGGPAFRDQPPVIANILASLVRQETKVASARLQRSVVGSFRDDVQLLTNPARHAHFMVLRAADIPSVLIEMGFMSNPKDEAALRTAAHRAQVAAAVRGAIEAFLGSASHGARTFG